jgi:hypothetical protein
MLAFLTIVMPLIASYDRICIGQRDYLTLLQDNYSTMAMPMLRSARVLDIRSEFRFSRFIKFCLRHNN